MTVWFLLPTLCLVLSVAGILREMAGPKPPRYVRRNDPRLVGRVEWEGDRDA